MVEMLGATADATSADSLAVQIAAIIVALTSLVGAIGALLNRRSLSTKAVNGQTTIFGRPKKANIGDVMTEVHTLVELLTQRTNRFDKIDQKLEVIESKAISTIDQRLDNIEAILKRRRT